MYFYGEILKQPGVVLIKLTINFSFENRSANLKISG